MLKPIGRIGYSSLALPIQHLFLRLLCVGVCSYFLWSPLYSQAEGKDDTTSMHALIDSCREYLYKDSSKVAELSARLISQSTRASFSEGIVRGYICRGSNYWYAMNLDSSIAAYKTAIRYASAGGLTDLQIATYDNLGLAYQSLQMADSAEAYFQKAIDLAQYTGNNNRLISALVNLGLLHRFEQNFSAAARSLEKARRLSEDEGDLLNQAKVFSAMGILYSLLDDEQSALWNLKRSAELYEEVEADIVLHTVYANICNIYSEKLINKDSALYYSEKAKAVVPDLRADYLEYTSLVNLGVLYYNLGDYQTSFSSFLQADRHPLNVRFSEEQAIVSTNLGAVYLKFGMPDSASVMLEKALAVADSLELPAIKNRVLEYLILIDRNKERYKRVDERFQQLIEAKQKMQFAEAKQIMARNEVERELLKMAYDFDFLRLENERQRQEIRTERIRLGIITAFSILVIALTIILAVQNRKMYRAHLKLIAKNKEILSLAKEKRLIGKSTGEEKHNASSDSPNWDTIAAKLDLVIHQQKVYLDTQLTVDQLAERIGASRHQLSLYFSHCLHTNFNEFLNRFRVLEAQQCLQSPEYANLTMSSICKQCGFNSERTFYNAFKAETGVTPAFYQKQYNQV